MISKTHFRAVCWFGLGVFIWARVVELTLMCGVTPTFSARALVPSLFGVMSVVYALKHEEQWYAEELS